MESTKPIRVLMVEDSEADAELILLELKHGGLAPTGRRVDSESEFADALESPEWDLILSDFNLPGFGGLKALEMVKARGIDIPFILISGTIGEDMAVEAMKAGAHDYLIKGNLSRLAPAIDRELRECRMRASHRKLQEELRKNEESLRVSQKMEAVGRLAGGIAHDFNNLLTVMSGYNEMALASLEPSHPIRNDLEQVKESVAKAASLTHQLLAFSRGQVVAPQRVDINATVGEMHRMLNPLIGNWIEFTFKVEPGLEKIKIDPGQLGQVIMNLVLNARDAMPKGGKLHLQTENSDLQEPFSGFTSRFKPGPYVKLIVSDTGTGMDEKVIEHIFEPFFTTKEIGKGTGLGLATVYGIVKQFDGQIQVKSKPGRGTSFLIYFPAMEEDGEQYRAEKPVPETVSRGNETILVVDNDENVRSLIHRVLIRNGYQVVVAGDGEEALRLSQGCERIDLLLTETKMPGMNGLQLSGKLSRLNPKPKTIFMSGISEGMLDGEKPRNHDLDFLEKPFSPDRLLQKVQEAMK